MAKTEFERTIEHKEYTRCMFDHVFIDVDSCLVGIEGIDELSRMNMCLDKVEELTKAAMNGEVKFDEVFEKRLNIIQPQRYHLDEIAQLYIENITPDAIDVLHRLKAGGATVWLISGGYDEAIYPLANIFGVAKDHVLANHLFFDKDGAYKGYDGDNPLCRQKGKRLVINNLLNDGVIQGKLALIGDGVSEIEAKGVVDMCIGFGGHVIRDNVKNMADVFITEKTFRALVPILFE